MMLGLRLCVLLFTVASVAAAAAAAGGKDAPIDKWRALFVRMYSTAPFKDAVERMSLDEAKKSMAELEALAKTNPSGVSHEERDEVMFWSNASKFTPEHCRVEREFEFLTHYSKDMDTSAERPNLKVYLNDLKDRLVAYCLSVQEKLIVRPLSLIDARDTKLINSMARDNDERAANCTKVARYLSPLYNLVRRHKMRTNELLATETQRLYRSRILSVCTRIKNVPEQARDAINYIEYRGAVGRANPKVAQWLAALSVCESIGTSLKTIAYEVKILKRAQMMKSSRNSGRLSFSASNKRLRSH